MAKEVAGTGQWVTINGRHIFIREGESLDKAIRSLENENKFTKAKMDKALEQEAKIAGALGGLNLQDNEPFDVIVGRFAVEVKTMINGKNPKITMRSDALERKLAYCKRNRLKAVTVVADLRGKSPRYFYKNGIGSFRLSTMSPTTLQDLAKDIGN